MTSHAVCLPSLLDTDLYKLTMQQAVLHHFPKAQVTCTWAALTQTASRTAPRPCRSRQRASMRSARALSVRTRPDPDLGTLRFTPEEIEWLRTHCAYFRQPYLDYLAQMQLRPKEQVHLQFVPLDDGSGCGQLEIEIKGAWLDVILYEVPIMAIISETYFAMCDTDWTLEGQYEQAVQKGTELLEHGVILSDFGTRRRRSAKTHDEVVRGLVDAHRQVQASGRPGVGRLLGTSNVYLAKKYALIPSGTIAHEWTMAIAAMKGYEHANLQALQMWDEVYQPPAFDPATPSDNLTIALTDTFSTKVFWDDLASTDKGVEILRRWRGLRQDSGDSRAFVQHALTMYRKVGVDPSTKLIVFSDGLDVKRCLELQALAQEAGILAGFGTCVLSHTGVGTSLTNDFTRKSTGERSKPLNMVIKLYCIEGHPAVKISDDLTKNTGDQDEVEYVGPHLHPAWSSVASVSSASASRTPRSTTYATDLSMLIIATTSVSHTRTRAVLKLGLAPVQIRRHKPRRQLREPSHVPARGRPPRPPAPRRQRPLHPFRQSLQRPPAAYPHR